MGKEQATIEKGLSVMDILEGIIAYSDLTSFPKDSKFIQDFTREAKEDTQFSELLSEIVFSEGVDIYPFSRKLHQTERETHFGGLITSSSGNYLVDEGTRKKIRDEMANFPDVEKIRLLGEMFRARVEKK